MTERVNIKDRRATVVTVSEKRLGWKLILWMTSNLANYEDKRRQSA